MSRAEVRGEAGKGGSLSFCRPVGVDGWRGGAGALCVGLLLGLLMSSLCSAASAMGIAAGLGHVCVAAPDGGVQCWGANGYGQLGDGTLTDRSAPIAVTGLAGQVTAVAAGSSFSCALTGDHTVQCWGRNNYGQLGDGTVTNSPTPVTVSGLTDAVALATGSVHSCALLSGGTVRCWGYNAYGQLGDGTVTNQSTPVTVSGLTGAAAVVGGGYHTCVVTTTGAAKCWGDNDYGQLGDGTITQRHSPVVVAGLTGVVTMAAGSHFTCALQVGGVPRCWGRNEYGQLGDGTTTDHSTAAAVTGLASGVAAIVAGYTDTCAVLGTGALRCWGDNTDGQVGDGTTTSPRTTAVAVSGLASGVATAVTGDGHTCALLSNAGVKCWGKNASGQLGDGTTINHLTAASVSGLTGGEAPPAPGVQGVEAGNGHVCSVTNAGGVVCWGKNDRGQLGDGTTTDRTAPAAVHGLANGVVAVTAGDGHSCALTTGGGVKCWGRNELGQLGDGTITERTTPVDVSGLTSGVAAVSAGAYHTCALTTGGGVKCWGNNGNGQLGDGTTTERHTPVSVVGLGSGALAVAAGALHACAVSTTGGLRCWGYNGGGQVGDGTTTDRWTPVWVSGLTSGVATVVAGANHTCALTTGGVKCWGYNADGQVGDGTTTNRATPVIVSGLAGEVLSVAAGYEHSCARSVGGRLLCWGRNAVGGLGDGTTTDRVTPVAVSGLATGTTAVGAGANFTCAVTSRGGMQCWGYNGLGQLGDGTITSHSKPGWVAGFVGSAGAVSAGAGHSCRVTQAGGVQCWGSNSSGQLGDGSTITRRTAVDAAGLTSGVIAVSAANGYGCALTSAGAVKCWGYNGSGQLGDGTTTSRSTPVGVAGLAAGAAAVDAGGHHACALTSAGGVLCWGDNASYQLGDGTTTNRSTPGYVTGLTSGIIGLALGSEYSCALTAAGGMLCWGDNFFGNLGNGTTTTSPAPTWVSGLTSGVRAVAAGVYHTCAVTAAGAVKCWGRNVEGQLGNGTNALRTTPTAVVGLTSAAVDLSTGPHSTCALTAGVGMFCWGMNNAGQLGDGTVTNRSTPVAVSGLSTEAAAITAGSQHTCAATASGVIECWGENGAGQLANGTSTDRLTPTAVRGFKLEDDYDADVKADIAVYRPSTGTWFSLNSSTGNASYQYRGWGVQGQGDVPVSGCDFDGDGIVDPTVFRPASGTWFVLESAAGFTTWDFFGWGTTGDTPVPADYDGDGITDGAVYRAGTWYIRPSGGGTQWNVTFGNSTDVPIPGHYDADGKADLAVYRPATGTWFILTSSSGYASYWYKGWGAQASGDTPAPGDYDGDGRMDLCVFRATTGTWFILESHASFTTWAYYGWGASGDTVVPSDYDGDGITDAAVYRPSNYTWYVRPSSGASQWSVVFGASGDVPLITIR